MSEENVRPRRINVAVNEPMLAAIDLIIDQEGVTLTEAVRRLIAYGEFVYTAVRVEDASLQLVTTEGVREIHLL